MADGVTGLRGALAPRAAERPLGRRATRVHARQCTHPA